MPSSDRIEKSVLLRAPRTRVFRALTDATEFGTWFGVQLEGPFAAGQPVRGRITIPGAQHLVMNAEVERIEPETYFSFRWRPYAIDPKRDYSAETPTLVEFFLSDEEGGTRLRVVESGFDKVPEDRRAEAFRMNDRGWGIQLQNIERHVSA